MSELAVAWPYTKRLPQASQWVELRFVAFKQTSPSQIIRQVLRGHTMKRNHPVLESTIVGIYVLDVESPIKKRDRIINVVGRLFLAGLFISFPQAAKSNAVIDMTLE